MLGAHLKLQKLANVVVDAAAPPVRGGRQVESETGGGAKEDGGVEVGQQVEREEEGDGVREKVGGGWSWSLRVGHGCGRWVLV